MTDFESRFFDQLVEDNKEIKSTLKGVTKKLDKTYEQALKTNSRVDRLDKEVFNKVEVKDLSPWYKDPNTIRIFLYLSIALLLLVGAAVRADVSGVL